MSSLLGTARGGERRRNRSRSRLTRCPGRYRNRIRTPRHFRPRERRTTPSTPIAPRLSPPLLLFFARSLARSFPTLPSFSTSFCYFLFFSFFSLFLPLSMFLLFSRPPFQEILKYSKRRFRDHACVDDFSVVSISWKFWKQVFHFRFHLVLLSRVFLKKGWLLNLRIDEIFVYLEEKFLIIYII